MTICMVGWSHSPFGRHDNETVEDLIIQATVGALTDAGIEAADVDAIFLGHFNGGFSAQGFTAPLIAHADPAFHFKPMTRVENACATGSAALFQASTAIRAGEARCVLVVGVEKMTGIPPAQVGPILLKAAYIPEETENTYGFPGVFARIAQTYFQKYGDVSDSLARIAAKNHKNGCANPYAHIRKDMGFEFCARPSDKNPILAGPLRRTDCSPVSDGAAAVVLMGERDAKVMKRAVRIRGMAQTTDYLPLARRNDITSFIGCRRAWEMALGDAGVSLNDLSLIETHDCFTIAELIEYEAMGLTPVGQGRRAIDEGWVEKGGKLPVNPSGGLKSKGHPIGATGVSMHVMGAMQVAQEAGDMQIPGARLAGVFNMGGVAVANYCSILEAL